MMMKYFVNFAWTDDYGFEKETEIKWFDTEKEAFDWVQKMKKGNGGYFVYYRTERADYNEYMKMIELQTRLAKLKEKFFEKA